MDIAASIAAYEKFLGQELGAELVQQGLEEKRDAMRESAFAFLRATFWRWAETIKDIAPAAFAAPSVLAVGDIHLENFGTWRDADGRLVWGVNDFDEAAEMPYTLDLIRLAASALLALRAVPAAQALPVDATAIADALITGYRRGLERPRACVLDRDLGWLRELVAVPDTERQKFWEKLVEKRAAFDAMRKPPRLWPRYRAALLGALPAGATEPRFWYRSAGLGSLGRPRWVAEAEWCGDWVLREAKGIVVSAWTREHGRGGRAIRCMEIATGQYRAPDPWYRVVDGVAVRRLSANSRKIDASLPDADKKKPNGIRLDALLRGDMLGAMGSELAMLHLGGAMRGAQLSEDLAARPRGWLAGSATRAADATEADFNAYRTGAG